MILKRCSKKWRLPFHSLNNPQTMMDKICKITCPPITVKKLEHIFMMKCKVHVSYSGIEGQNGSYKFTGLERAKVSILCQTDRICNMFYLPQHYFLMTSRKCIACFKTIQHGSQCIDNVNPKHTIAKTCVLGRPVWVLTLEHNTPWNIVVIKMR
jgi:hypothetical protein